MPARPFFTWYEENHTTSIVTTECLAFVQAGAVEALMQAVLASQEDADEACKYLPSKSSAEVKK